MYNITFGGMGQSRYSKQNTAKNKSSTPLRDQCLFSELANFQSGRTAKVHPGILANAWTENGQELHLDYDESSTQENPVIKAWGIDSKGQDFERLIHVNEVDPRNASPAEMRALEAHLKKQGDSVISSSGMREWRVGEAMWGFDVNEKLDFMQFLNEGAQMAIEPEKAAKTRMDAERFLFHFLQNQGRQEKSAGDSDDYRNRITEINEFHVEGSGENMVKTTIINGQRLYIVDREVMEAHGCKVTTAPSYFNEIVQTWKEGEKKDALSEEELNALKQRYDPDNMTEKECICLLGELAEAGILTSSEAAGIYHGGIPVDITKQNGMLQKCTPEMEAVKSRWNKVSGGINRLGNLNRKMGCEYFEAWYDWAKLNTNVDNPDQEKSFVNTRRFIEILKELRACGNGNTEY